MSNIQDEIEAATAQAVAKAAIALANAAVAREKYKNRMIERRDAGDTCTGDYKELKIADLKEYLKDNGVSVRL